MWEQRFYSDGTLAPCWGYQIDETASVIYGVYDHYTRTKDVKFLKDNLKMLEKAMKFLEKYIEDTKLENRELRVSYDLWEMHEGESIYSYACIYSAYDSMIKIYSVLENDDVDNKVKQDSVLKQKQTLIKRLGKLKRYTLDKFFDEEKKSFVRNEKDKKLDISILGIVTPFKMFSASEKKILNTIERINMNLRTYTGGFLRFEQDHYTNDRPWVIATLWMALYQLQARDKRAAKECFDFVINSCTENGFLAEQVENRDMSSAWVIGLAWSHAMFVIVLEEFIKCGII